jgi:pilus assembly protein Flp/PilA
MSATFIKKIVDDTAGATAIEYSLIVALIVIAMMASLGTVAERTNLMWNDVSSRITEAIEP